MAKIVTKAEIEHINTISRLEREKICKFLRKKAKNLGKNSISAPTLLAVADALEGLAHYHYDV